MNIIPPKSLSVDSHNKTDYLVRTLDDWKKYNEDFSKIEFNTPQVRVKDLLDKFPNIRNFAIDIGCGGGWMSNELSKYFEYVIAIDPSNYAIEICKKLYTQSNIIWIVGYSDDVLQSIDFDFNASYFINSCSVFQHIDDAYTIPTLKFINDNFKHGILSLQEWWSENRHFNQGMGNCRTKMWWKQQLSNWDLDFHGPSISNCGEYFESINKGLHGHINKS